MPETLTITLQDLQKAFEGWERDFRDGLTLSREEADKLPISELAQRSAEHFWERLKRYEVSA